MWRTLLALIIICYLPGAVLFRLPIANRPKRASLPIEERFYWSVVLSVLISTTVALVLGALGLYTLERLMGVSTALALLMILAASGRLRLGSSAPQLTWTAAIPAGLIALGAWMYFAVPAAEYIIGGRDPGVYVNEGVQIAQRRSLVTTDALVREVSTDQRDLFFPSYNQASYHGIRFMGFFLIDPAAGTVVGQFPHGYPVWIAIAYGIDGLSGTRRVVGWWAVLGILSVYFAAAHLLGRAPATAAAVLLAVHVIQTWHARSPNSEIVTQVLLFAGLHAHARAHAEDDAFFAPVGASLLGLAAFVRLPAIFAAGAAVAASLLAGARRRVKVMFAITLVGWAVVAAVYYSTLLAPYSGRPLDFVRFLTAAEIALLIGAGLVLAALIVAAERPQVGNAIRTALARGLPLLLGGAAAYAYFLREPAARLAPHDAYALKTFADFYLTRVGLLLAIIGYALVAWRSFWKSPALMLATAAFAGFFFYKLRIFPEQFWTTRRFVDLILPAVLLFIAATLLLPLSRVFAHRWPLRPTVAIPRAIVGLIAIAILAYQYLAAAQPLRTHIEYAELIPNVERLAARFGDDDLVIVEARQASDLHALALPLSYIYARNVLVLYSARPDKPALARFLAASRPKYQNVFFLGAGGTDLLGPGIALETLETERFEAPEYEVTAYNVYPQRVLLKPFTFTIYRFVDEPAPLDTLTLDIGGDDDLRVIEFHVKERLGRSDVTFRWTQDRSYVLAPRIEPATRALVLRLSNGGRPPTAVPARVSVFLDGQPLGEARPIEPFADYTFAIAPQLAAQLAARGAALELRLESTTWSPRQISGAVDKRVLGVMLDRVEFR